ncbi:MAG: hypothetical protein O9282_02945 [Flavobacterium sp.]|uniref:hypothetical protein n=1 Tax=Flavobacterium sp. TaxID=239 RepID=UPI0022C5D1FC|nr:hypothetical protein [Flavobacterium sp.]MCZ8330250.1 hypothetical protein [Flavobacterium sp.]
MARKPFSDNEKGSLKKNLFDFLMSRNGLILTLIIIAICTFFFATEEQRQKLLEFFQNAIIWLVCPLILALKKE